jgi:putative PIG3 family NAD(P)H quinone oxidoreductase
VKAVNYRLEIGQVNSPSLRPGEVKIKVHAFGINRADLSQKKGLYPPPPGESEILGLEAAGEIIELAPGVSGVSKGDRVMALLPGGGYAEEVCIDAGLTMPLPSHYSWQEGAAVPEAFLTAYQNLFRLGQIKKGQPILIHAGASGVGTAAIQLAVSEHIETYTTVGTESKEIFCKTLGAKAINYKNIDFGEVIPESSIQFILDPVGGSYFASNLRVLATEGKLVVIATMGGKDAQLDLGVLHKKRLRLMGSTLRNLSLEEKRKIVSEFSNQFYSSLKNQLIKPVIDSVLPISDIETAHQIMSSNQNIGKIIVKW